jgi:hypothetical protein
VPCLETLRQRPSQDNRKALAAAVFTGKLDKALPLLEQSVAAEPATITICA